MNNDSVIEVLLVEDNPADARLIVEVFDGFKINNNISTALDGAVARDYLYKKGEFKDVETPSIIILDLNLPKKDGREVLREIKNDEKLKSIPVIVLTTSSDEKDIEYCYKNHANVYLHKPAVFNEFEELISSLENFWFDKAILPKIEGY